MLCLCVFNVVILSWCFTEHEREFYMELSLELSGAFRSRMVIELLSGPFAKDLGRKWIHSDSQPHGNGFNSHWDDHSHLETGGGFPTSMWL